MVTHNAAPLMIGAGAAGTVIDQLTVTNNQGGLCMGWPTYHRLLLIQEPR
jgi:hypothetical protein